MEKNKSKPMLLGLGIVIITLIVAGAMSFLLYRRTVELLTTNLQQRLLSIATTAVAQIDAKDIEALQTEADYKKPEWKRVVSQMRKMRVSNNDIIFMYIFRRSKADPSQMVFVADSHSIDPYANVDSDIDHRIDVNADGIINETDVLQWPGQPYSSTPIEGVEAYGGPTTNHELYSDSWGTYISGYAPIMDEDGNVVGILAADVQANDFYTITTQTLTPFLGFILGLIGVILVLAGSLIKIWTRQIELVVELDRQKDELLSIVSHQLATPITSIKWYLEMMLSGDLGKLTDAMAEHVKSMQGIALNLVDLVGMILDVSRIQLGRMKIEKQKMDLNGFFKEILEVIEPKAKEKQINFIKEMPSTLPEAMLDKRYTRMTIENLLSNAVKYTPEKGTVQLKLEIKNNTLFCSVKDTGCGIPKQDQTKIFGKLFRASNVRNTVDGNGFGLYVAKGAIEAQGGKIGFESEEGKGTTFSVELPLS